MTAAVPASRMGRPFWTLWSAASISFVGDGLLLGALPLLALTLTKDPRLIAAVDAMTMVGWLLLGLVSGVLVDRVHKVKLMSRIDLVRAVILGALVAAMLTGHLTIAILVIVTLALGMTSPFFDNAAGAIVPELVEPSNLEKANSWLQAPMILLATLIGPPVGAILFSIGDEHHPFLFDALSFALSAAILQPLVRRLHGRGAPSPTQPERIHVMLREGVGFLRRHLLLRNLALATGAANTILGGVTAVLVLYVTDEMHLSPSAYGWVVATFALGGVVGAVACGAIVRRIGTRASVIGTLFCFAAAVTSLGAAPNLWVVIPVAAIAGAAETMWSITTISYRQRVTPPDLLGRVTSIYRMLAFLGIPVGALAAGYMAHATNTRTAYLVGGLALLAFAIASTPGLRSLPTRSVTPVPALPQEPPHAHPRPNEQADHRSPVSREGPIRISDN